MNKTLGICLFLQLLSFFVTAQSGVSNLLVENLKNPVGLDVRQPRFSWQLTNDRRNIRQQAYEIKVLEGKSVVWNTGRVESKTSVHVAYGGSELKSGKTYGWQVRVWDNSGKPSAWSAPSRFQMALLNESDWKASWIIPGYVEDSVLRPSPMFRKEFSATKKIVSAVAYITAHGMYEAQINGKRVGDAYLTPGWTSYNKRLQYQVYDVASLLTNGKNAIGITLGSGWYRGSIGWETARNFYGKDIALLFQLNITYSDGSSELVVSDGSWKSSSDGPIRYSEIYNGEIYDARMEKNGWAAAGYNDGDWTAVKTSNFPLNTLVATYNEPVKKHEIFTPVKIFTSPSGEKIVDFGQNMVGWVVIKLKGNAGDSIKLSHAEVMDKNGNFYTDNLRAAKAENIYILKDGGEESFEPHFTWQGFRYVRIEGLKTDIRAEDIKAVTLYSDMKTTGSFISSNNLINQLQKNIVWGQKGNFLDVPTDCPQRDERLGWTGDAQAFSRTASFNMNVNNFFAKWLRDLEADQVNGSVPFVIPNVLNSSISSAGWADVVTIAPWNMYLAYGDKRLLMTQYSSMKNYVDQISRSAKNYLWNTGFHFGDWLFYRPDDDNDGRAAVTDKYLIAQCFYAHSTQLLINAAKVLGKNDDVDAYTKLLQNIKDAYAKEYVTPSGRLVSSTQTAYVLALQFDMLPENLRQQAAKRLADNIKNYDDHLTTGFLGTPYLCHVLTRYGYLDVAYTLLLQDSYPSWLYPVKMGATTIWERWDGIKPDGSFQVPSMNSYNHYAYGAIGDWMYRTVAGLDTYEDGPGYEHIRIKPSIGGGFNHILASLDTYYGTTSISWKLDGGQLLMDIVIPANTRATVFIPSKAVDDVKENGASLSASKDIQVKGIEEGFVVVELGSGKYFFTTAR